MQCGRGCPGLVKGIPFKSEVKDGNIEVSSTGNLPERKVVTCFLKSDNKILILRRSKKVGSYRGRWGGVSGYIETTPDDQALLEIEQETSLPAGDVRLVKRGEPLSVKDFEVGVTWVVHPYLFEIRDPDKIKINWENKELKWIKPEELVNYETVPKLKEALAQVYGN